MKLRVQAIDGFWYDRGKRIATPGEVLTLDAQAALDVIGSGRDCDRRA